jgi:hypothetical protein
VLGGCAEPTDELAGAVVSPVTTGCCETGCAGPLSALTVIGLFAPGLVIFRAVEELEAEMSAMFKSAVLLELMSSNEGANGGVAAEVLDLGVMGETGEPWNGDNIRMFSLSVLRASVDNVGFLDTILVGAWWTGAFPSNVGLDAPASDIGAIGVPLVVAAGEVGVDRSGDAVDSINAFK